MGKIGEHNGIPLYENISDVPYDLVLSGKQFGILERNVPTELINNEFKKAPFINIPGHSLTLLTVIGIISIVVVIGIVGHVLLQDMFLLMTASEMSFESESPEGNRTYTNKVGDLVVIGPNGDIISSVHVGGLAWLNQVVILVVVIIIAILLFYYMRSR